MQKGFVKASNLRFKEGRHQTWQVFDYKILIAELWCKILMQNKKLWATDYFYGDNAAAIVVKY